MFCCCSFVNKLPVKLPAKTAVICLLSMKPSGPLLLHCALWYWNFCLVPVYQMASQSFLQLPVCQAKTVISKFLTINLDFVVAFYPTLPNFSSKRCDHHYSKGCRCCSFLVLQLSQLQYWQLLHYGTDIQVNLCRALCLMLLARPLLFINRNYLANILQCVHFSSFNSLLIFQLFTIFHFCAGNFGVRCLRADAVPCWTA